ncbi:hypothetical protein [Sagittula stellata]|uniref:Lipoprotein, putative n=1 Tax=Sagittula stellata (strain ATCC 700073 / DSM 11524 / E-37) TaxID=388399 RepID=A3K732_SAGS3|nr:hypothetical protein [Sagittula stellata]EBA07159.1 lipoprotein, putative [Sagittula stellata E-37]
MSRTTLVAIHGIAGATALLTIVTFWGSALTAELVLSTAGIVIVRTAILYAVPVLVLAMIAAGASGTRLAGRSRAPVIVAKRRRTMLAAANGLIVLVPSAVFLGLRAQVGQFGAPFAVVQIVELAAGAVNILLLGLNMKSGFSMRARRVRAGKAAS